MGVIMLRWTRTYKGLEEARPFLIGAFFWKGKENNVKRLVLLGECWLLRRLFLEEKILRLYRIHKVIIVHHPNWDTSESEVALLIITLGEQV